MTMIKKIFDVLKTSILRFRHNWAWKSFAIVFAIAFWVYIMFLTNPSKEITFDNVPVTVIGTEQMNSSGLTLDRDINEYEFAVRVVLKTSVQDSIKINKNNIFVTADLSGIKTEGVNSVQLKATTSRGEVVRLYPDTVTINVDKIITRTLPVACTTEGNLPDGYWHSNIALSPQTMKVSGPQNILNNAAQVHVTVPLDGLTQDFNQSVRCGLVDGKGDILESSAIDFDTEDIIVDMKVRRLVDARVIVSESVLGKDSLEDGYEIVGYDIYPSTVKVAVPADFEGDALVYCEPIDVKGASQDITARIGLVEHDGIILVSDNAVDVIIRIDQRKTSLSLENVPVHFINYDADLYTITAQDESLGVTIEGGELDLKGFRKEDVRLEVDMDGLTAGTYHLPVTATVGDGITVDNIIPTLTYITVKMDKKG